jgi:hypothetical protein
MQHLLDELIHHLSLAHAQAARVLEAERHVAVRMAQIIQALPDQHPDLGAFDGLMEHSRVLGKSIVAYLNNIADLQEAMAEHLAAVMKELDGASEE